MSNRYRITPEGRGALSEEEVSAHADSNRLLYNYHRAVRPLYKRPLYKDPKAFIALLILLLLVLLIMEAVGSSPGSGQKGPSHLDERDQQP